MKWLAEFLPGTRPWLKVALLALVVGLCVLSWLLDLDGIFFLVLAPVWLVQIWQKQSVGIFSREHDPLIFWPTIAILVLFGIQAFYQFVHSLAIAVGLSPGAIAL